MSYPSEDMLNFDALSETQALILGDMSCLGHPMVDAIHEALDLDEFSIGPDGMIALLPSHEPVFH
jgi:hypothetical protein